MTLADTIHAELAAIDRQHRHPTRRYVAERIAQVCVDHTPPAQPPPPYVSPLEGSDLIFTEMQRMRAQIRDLRTQVAKLKAERGTP